MEILKKKKYLALLIAGATLLAIGLSFVFRNPIPAANSLIPAEVISYGGQLNMMQSDDKTEKNIDIELLYLDLSVCGPCQGTEATFDEAISEVRPVLQDTGFYITVTKTLVENETQAQNLGFVSSPTIRINGHDIQPGGREDLCNSCSSLCGDDVNCRVWVYEGKEYWAPPKAMIIEAIMSEAYGGTKQNVKTPTPSIELPDNLKRFFAAKEELGSEDGSTCCPPSSDCCSH